MCYLNDNTFKTCKLHDVKKKYIIEFPKKWK